MGIDCCNRATADMGGIQVSPEEAGREPGYIDSLHHQADTMWLYEAQAREWIEVDDEGYRVLLATLQLECIRELSGGGVEVIFVDGSSACYSTPYEKIARQLGRR